MKKNDYNFIRDIRSQSLWSLYKQMRESGAFPSLTAICREIEQMEQPLHFISYRMARQAFNSYFYRRKMPKRLWPQKKILYDSFIQKCVSLRTENPSMEDREVIWFAVLAPAPCIGLSEDQIRRTLISMGAK